MPNGLNFKTRQVGSNERTSFVAFDREYGDFHATLEGALSVEGFGSADGEFGPEVGFGFELGNQWLGEDVVIIKAGGMTALAADWLPPSSNGGGSNGAFYTEMIQDIQDSLARVDEITGTNGQVAELSGLVWFHGYADAFDADFRSQYEVNLANLLLDIRSDLSLPSLPSVIGELGGQGSDPSNDEAEMREIQQRVANADANALFSCTSQYITGFDTSNPDEMFDGNFHYWGRADGMIRIGREFATDMLALMSRNVSNEPTPAPSNTVSADIPHRAGFPVAIFVTTSLVLFLKL
jgi:hypothetical protein